MAHALDDNFLAITAIITILYQGGFFAIAATLKFDKVTDFAGTTNFVLLAFLTAIIKGTWYFRQVLLTMFVVVWGLKLAIFLLIRILKWGEDKRFDNKRDNMARFAVFWIIQAVWVWTVSLPVTVVNASSSNPPLEARDAVGWTLWIAGVVIETIADYEKLQFKNNPANKNKWCDVGLWRSSRHPNYFGEMLLWWGVFVAATPILHGGQWAVIFSPLFVMFLLLFVSGMPLLEASAEKQYGSIPEYRNYKISTSPLIPYPNFSKLILYEELPLWVKRIFFFEYPMYTKNATGEDTS